MKSRPLYLAVLVALAAALAAPAAQAQDEGRTRDDVLTAAFGGVARKAAPSVVQVVSAAGDVVGHAVVLEEGRAVTSQRNVRGLRRFTLVTADGGQVRGEIRGWDGWLDVALIVYDPSEADIEPIRRGDAPEVGDWVVTVGTADTPLGVGVVSALDRDVSENRKNPGVGLGFMSPGFRTPMRPYRGVIQHDTPLEKGETGSPLVDVDGRIVGLNVARPYRSTSFAVPIAMIDEVLPDLVEGKRTEPPSDVEAGAFNPFRNFFGDPERMRREWNESVGDDVSNFFDGLRKGFEALRRAMEDPEGRAPPSPRVRRAAPPPPVRPGYLGLEGETEKRRGLRVTKVVANSPAEAAGLQKGDILRSIDGERIRNRDDFARRVKNLPAGMRVRLRYERLDEASGEWVDRSVDLVLGEREDTF